MEKVIRRQELRVITENRIGILAEISGLVAARGVNIENICAYAVNDKAYFYLITDDSEKAKRSLQADGYPVEEAEVLVISLWDRPGSLALVANILKDKGINLQYIYGTTSKIEGRMAAVFSSDDNHKALEDFGIMIADRLLDANP